MKKIAIVLPLLLAVGALPFLIASGSGKADAAAAQTPAYSGVSSVDPQMVKMVERDKKRMAEEKENDRKACQIIMDYDHLEASPVASDREEVEKIMHRAMDAIDSGTLTTEQENILADYLVVRSCDSTFPTDQKLRERFYNYVFSNSSNSSSGITLNNSAQPDSAVSSHSSHG